MASSTKKKIAIRPLLDRVVAQKVEQEEAVKGGIILPDSVKSSEQQIARVVEVGPGRKRDGEMVTSPVQVGEEILIDKYAAQTFTVDDQEYLIVKFDDIIAVVN